MEHLLDHPQAERDERALLLEGDTVPLYINRLILTDADVERALVQEQGA